MISLHDIDLDVQNFIIEIEVYRLLQLQSDLVHDHTK